MTYINKKQIWLITKYQIDPYKTIVLPCLYPCGAPLGWICGAPLVKAVAVEFDGMSVSSPGVEFYNSLWPVELEAAAWRASNGDLALSAQEGPPQGNR